jgi:hypothetical protein
MQPETHCNSNATDKVNDMQIRLIVAKPTKSFAMMVSMLCAAVFGNALAQAPGIVGPYEIVRGGYQPTLCRKLVDNLNRFKDEPPQVCRRKFDPSFTDFRLPNWRELRPEEARPAALAVVLAPFRRHHAEDAPPIRQLTKEVESAAEAGKLSVWEAQFDIARNGEIARVVLVSRGICRVENNHSIMDPSFGVLLPDRNEIDKRYELISGHEGDIFFNQDVSLVSSWSSNPGAEGSGDPGPKKEHRGYLFVSEILWEKDVRALTLQGRNAFLSSTGCQIGYHRLERVSLQRDARSAHRSPRGSA